MLIIGYYLEVDICYLSYGEIGSLSGINNHRVWIPVNRQGNLRIGDLKLPAQILQIHFTSCTFNTLTTHNSHLISSFTQYPRPTERISRSGGQERLACGRQENRVPVSSHHSPISLCTPLSSVAFLRAEALAKALAKDDVLCGQSITLYPSLCPLLHALCSLVPE